MGWEVGAGGEPKGRVTKHSDTNSSAMSSVSDLDWHNSQGRISLAPHAVLSCPSGATHFMKYTPVVCKSSPGYLK